jgi:hypothetical protein
MDPFHKFVNNITYINCVLYPTVYNPDSSEPGAVGSAQGCVFEAALK